jgi:hypothetical protein
MIVTAQEESPPPPAFVPPLVAGTATSTASANGYRSLKRQGGHKWSGPDVKQMRNSTRLGCAGCNVLICEACWPHFNHVTKCAERDFSGQVTRVLEGQE